MRWRTVLRWMPRAVAVRSQLPCKESQLWSVARRGGESASGASRAWACCRASVGATREVPRAAAWSAFDPRGTNALHSAQGAGGLGYGYPAALGVAVADPARPVLAVSGDGGAMYSIAELATARQYDLPVTWLIVDDGGYGILREYMTDAFGEATGTELTRPDFVALAGSFGIPAVRTSPERLGTDLAAALAAPGPSVVVLPARLRMFAPTHLES